MSTDLDTRLREGLARRVNAVEPPPIYVEDLVRRGRRRRGRRAGLAGLVTAGVVAAALVVGLVLPGHGSGPSGRNGVPIASGGGVKGGPAIATGGAVGPTRVPGPTGLFVTRTKVYLGGASYDVKLPFGTGAHVSSLGVAYPAPRTDRPTLLTDAGKVVPLAGAAPAGRKYDGWVAADGNGSLVSWAEVGPSDSRIVAYDAAARRVVGTVTVACHGRGEMKYCPTPCVVSDGIVFVSVYGKTRAWNPSTGTFSNADVGDVNQAHAKTLTTFEDRGDVDLGGLGSGWGRARSPKGITEAGLSYDGSWILGADGGRPIVVNWKEPAQTITYRPPGHVKEVVFDTDGSLLVVTHDDGRWTGWDCELRGSCKAVVSPQSAEIRLVAWDT